jgi:para-nitrobenzyl esterase
MMSYWAEFAYTGNPGRGRDGRQVPWLPWGTDGKTSILLDTVDDGGIRMDDVVVTTESVKAELVADTGFPDKQDHCGVYVRTFRGTDLFDEQEYQRIGCASFPPEDFSQF